jgi:hypothetical protein
VGGVWSKPPVASTVLVPEEAEVVVVDLGAADADITLPNQSMFPPRARTAIARRRRFMGPYPFRSVRYEPWLMSCLAEERFQSCSVGHGLILSCDGGGATTLGLA